MRTTVSDELIKFAKAKDLNDERLQRYTMYLREKYGRYLDILAVYCPDHLRHVIQRDYELGNKYATQILKDTLDYMERCGENEQTTKEETP